MDNNILLHEISVDEQYEVVGGDWLGGFTSVAVGAAFLAGMFGAPFLLLLAATAGIASAFVMPLD